MVREDFHRKCSPRKVSSKGPTSGTSGDVNSGRRSDRTPTEGVFPPLQEVNIRRRSAAPAAKIAARATEKLCFFISLSFCLKGNSPPLLHFVLCAYWMGYFRNSLYLKFLKWTTPEVALSRRCPSLMFP